MNWLNVFIPNLRSSEFSNSEPAARATWLSVLAYCCEQENGGVIFDAAEWSDRAWLQNCGCTAAEARNAAPLVAFSGGNVTVWNYPEEREKEVQSKREAGTRGGLAKTQAKTQAAKLNGAKGGRPKTQAETQASEEITQSNREEIEITQAENPSITQAEPKQKPNGIGKEQEEEGNWKGTVKGKRKELKPSPLALVEFDRFWTAYPKKAGKEKAREAWIKADVTFEDCEPTIKAWAASEQWTKNDGQFIPMPATWLNQKRWQDEAPRAAKPAVDRMAASDWGA